MEALEAGTIAPKQSHTVLPKQSPELTAPEFLKTPLEQCLLWPLTPTQRRFEA